MARSGLLGTGTALAKPTNIEFREIFDAQAPHFDNISNSYSVSRRRDILTAWARGDCLDVGAGTGAVSRGLMQNHRVVATDISPNMVAQIKQNLGIEARQADAEQLPFPDGSFDTVVASECIYYLDHPERFIAEANRVLRPGGRLLISSANHYVARFYDRLRAVLRAFGFSSMYFDDRARIFSTSEGLRKLLSQGNFKVQEEKKILVLPMECLDAANRLLEQTPFRHLGIFILMRAEKLPAGPGKDSNT